MEPEPRLASETAVPETVICSHSRAGYVLVTTLLFGATAVFGLSFAGTKHGEPIPDTHRPFFWVIAALLSLTATLIVRMTQLLRLDADVDGVRWRGAWGGERFAAWHDISDYYICKRVNWGQGVMVPDAPTVVTANGTWRILADFEHLDDFKRVVTARATASRADRWERFGVRPFDPFPRTFRYWNFIVALNVVGAVAASLFLVITCGTFFAHQAQSTAAQIGWNEATPSIASGVILCAAFLLATAILTQQFLAVWRRRGETITVTPETVRYDNAATGETLEARWQDVEDYFYRPVRRSVTIDSDSGGEFVLVLRGADENQIVWHRAMLIDSRLLLEIVTRYAPPPRPTGVTPLSKPDDASTQWRKQNVHAATGGSDPATWASGAVGVGDRRVFRHRSPLFAGMLWLGVLIVSLFLLAYFFAVNGWTKAGPENAGDMLWVIALTAAPVLWGAVCYRMSRVETDDMGLTQFHPFGRRYLPWFALAGWKESAQSGKPFDHLRVRGRNGVTLRLLSSLLGYDELRAELGKHAPPAPTE